MAFPYDKALVIGAISGIGLELAERLVREGVYVIAVGRRQKNLDTFVSKASTDKAFAVPFNVTETDQMPALAKRYIPRRNLNHRRVFVTSLLAATNQGALQRHQIPPLPQLRLLERGRPICHELYQATYGGYFQDPARSRGELVDMVASHPHLHAVSKPGPKKKKWR